MAKFFAFYPPSGSGSVNASVGVNGATAPTSSTEVGGVGPDGNLHPIAVDNSGRIVTVADPTSVQHVIVDSSALPTGASTSALQTTGNASLASIDTKLTSPITVTGPLTDTQLRASPVPVSQSSQPLPTGAATAANQVTGNNSLASIDTKTPALGQALAAASVPVVLTAAQLSTLTPLTSVTVTQATGTNLHAVIDNFPATQPVSGSVTVVQPTGTNLHTVVDSGTITVTQATGTNLHTVVDSITAALPTGSNVIGALTANQSVNLAQIAGTAGLTGNGVTGAGSQRVTIASDNTPFTVNSKAAGKSIANAPVRNDYTSTPVTTAAYVQLVASLTTATTEIEIFDSSGQTLFLAVGAAASEVNQVLIFPGGNGRIPLLIAAGARISIKAASATANVGEISINWYS